MYHFAGESSSASNCQSCLWSLHLSKEGGGQPLKTKQGFGSTWTNIHFVFLICFLNLSVRDHLLALVEHHLHPPLLYKKMPLSFQRHGNGLHLNSISFLVLTIKRELWCSCIDMHCSPKPVFIVSSGTTLKRIKIFLTFWPAELHLKLYSWLHTIYCRIGKCQWKDAGAGFGSWTKW